MEQVRSDTQLVHNLRGGICVITKELFDEFSKTWKYPESVSEQYIIASIEFLLNFKTDETDVFWLDIEPAESLIRKWYEGYYVPEREGYTFIGWYKEPECINEWNFESDKTPAEVLDKTTGEPITQITRLYAKWTKN
ncbi:MAG: InlB B-repeat-containing protein [Clostridia bacterium]